ncbi:hypothetical protein BV25DRAFT_1874039 [Artomyces pyxidatus]|uniref:Uncharacterized protein n=1 Tax=Artomyces pyxidatus TaxID=48021 RepID=A0ACB8TK26_9AGAM|nr:hypothetical protein BV25DRAFT_1874039 [Artomyces pyxidatus]
MPTSELSDALNPNAAHSRPRTYSDFQTTISPPVVQHQAAFVPHRSELEYAIFEPPPPPPPIPVPPKPTRLDAGQIVQELLRAHAAAKEAHDAECRRRSAWEKQIEDRIQRREAELEAQLAEVKQEVTRLTAYIASMPPLPLPPRMESPLLIEELPSSSPAAIHEDMSMSDASVESPMIIEPRTPDLVGEPQTVNPVAPVHSPSTSVSPRISVPSTPISPPSVSSSRKRPTPARSDDDGDESSDTVDSRSSAGKRPLKRVNRHDTRCYTIQAAMRRHMYRVMAISHESDLPTSWFEGLDLGENEPIRFVWEKTTKKSAHNAMMKARVVNDLLANRRLYKRVPDADFTKKILEATFDQAYTTFRQKYKVQMDATAAVILKAREEHKAMKARRSGRKKLKLGHRVDSRQNNEAFKHATFDGALQMECMSSEESGDEATNKSAAKDKTLYVRGMPWRSTRLLRFFSILDEDDLLDKSAKPKRGVGRHDRNEGPPKDGFSMPPKGVSSWMISRRWLHDMQLSHPELLDLVKDLMTDPPGFDWTQFDALGYESDDELDPVSSAIRSQRLGFPSTSLPSTHALPPSSSTSYSLQDALAPVS